MECKRLDSIRIGINQKPILVKIDVQGFKLDVLKGFEEIMEVVDGVIMEVNFEKFYEKQASYKDIINFMEENNFSKFYQINDYFFDNSILTHCDLLFLRKQINDKIL